MKRLFERGDLIDSLDLNIGYESIQKLKLGWGIAPENNNLISSNAALAG